MDYDPKSKLVHGTEILERVNEQGETISARKVPMQFTLIDRPTFEQFAHAAGFDLEHLYGDYQRSPFSAPTSPYLICSLRKP